MPRGATTIRRHARAGDLSRFFKLPMNRRALTGATRENGYSSRVKTRFAAWLRAVIRAINDGARSLCAAL